MKMIKVSLIIERRFKADTPIKYIIKEMASGANLSAVNVKDKKGIEINPRNTQWKPISKIGEITITPAKDRRKR